MPDRPTLTGPRWMLPESEDSSSGLGTVVSTVACWIALGREMAIGALGREMAIGALDCSRAA